MPVSTRVRARPVIALAFAAALAAGLGGCATREGVSASSGSIPNGAASPRSTGTNTAQPIDGQCATSDLTGSIGQGSGGAAGSSEVTLILTNNGSSQCALQGWPGVSFVGGGNGTQLGNPATFDRSAPHETVVLQPGGRAQAPLKVAQAVNYPSAECAPQPADGFRVYPPGSTESLFIEAAGVTACAMTTVTLLTVGALAAP